MTAPPHRAGSREWWGLAIIALPCMLYSMDFTVLHLAVPALVADLRPTNVELLWIVDIYGFLLAGTLVTTGALGDRIGRRRLLLLGAAIFGLASIATAFAPTAEALIVARALLGVAAATLAPSTLSLIRNMFADPRQRTFAIGIWVASFSGGAAVGPLVGGALLEAFWWGSVFLVAVPIMALLLLLGPRLLPEYRDPQPGRLDLVSAALSLVALLAIVYGVKQLAGGHAGWSTVGAVVVGVLAGVAFIRRQTTLERPFIDLALFGSHVFSAMLAVYTLIFFVNFVAFLFIAQYLQYVLGMDALEAGLWTLPWGGAFIAGSLVTPALAAWLGRTTVIAGSLGVAAVGFLVLTAASSGLTAIVIGSALFSLGLAPATALATDVIIGAVPPERAGTASGLNETGSELGGALGIALIGSAANAFYRHAMGGNLPAGLPPGSADAVRETLGAALLVADQLPANVGRQLAELARHAFVGSIVLGFALCLVAMLAAVVFTLSTAKRLRRSEADLPNGERHA